MTGPLLRKVVSFAFASRIIACLLLVACSYLPNHDADVFRPPQNVDNELTELDMKVLKVLDGFLCWDARYFHFVASHGYVFLNTIAFLPLFPFLSRGIASFLLWPLTSLGLSLSVITVLAGVLLNNLCFILSAGLLYELGRRVMGDNTLSYKAALIFCFNPASVFFSVFYSESLFFFLTLMGILLVDSRRLLFASLFFGLGSTCRSNGLLNFVFLIHQSARFTFNNLLNLGKNKSWFSIIAPGLVITFFVFLPDLLYLAVMTLPFLAVQYYDYLLYCRPSDSCRFDEYFKQFLPKGNVSQSLISYGRRRQYVVLGNRPEWCNKSIPFPYSAVQNEHWNVGFLKYFEVRQLPNFALAAPIATLALYGIVAFCCNYPAVTKSVGILDSAYDKIFHPRERHIVKRLYPHVLHLAIILALSVFNIHIQVLTRMVFSSSPCIYWIISYAICRRVLVMESSNEMDIFKRLRTRKDHWIVCSERQRNGNLLLDDMCNFWRLHFTQKLLVLFVTCYFFAGILMHGNFLPWT